jgi:fatty acid desaturase
MFYLFSRVPLWIMLILGFVYSVSISWNINGISHNFIHNPYFRFPLFNRLFSILESITVGFSQIFYECIHMQHHKGNADRLTSMVRQSIGFLFTSMDTTVTPSTRSSTLS